MACLTDAEAWAIATTWQAELQGRVRLVTDRDGPADSIVQSYAWIRLDTPVPVTRAVLLSWTALAACRGFGAENHGFWKRVISALQEDPSPWDPIRFATDRQVSVSDEYGFFNQPGHAFPRFMVSIATPIDPQLDRLFTRDGPELSEELGAQLDALLARLEPFSTHRDATSPTTVDVSLRIRTPFANHDGVEIAALVGRVNLARSSTIAVFRICHALFVEPFPVRGAERLDQLLAFARDTPVRAGHFQLASWSENASTDVRAQWIRALLRLDPDEVRAVFTTLRLPTTFAHSAVFQAILSALPFAMSVHTLIYDVKCAGHFEAVDLPWIAYALFHPRARSSSWRHLDLRDLMITKRSFDVLTAMARGNNLQALLNGTEPDATAYFSAELVPGTAVMLGPSATTDAVLFANTSVRVDLCGVSSTDTTTWSEWVAVVVPAYGLGYVRKHELQAPRAHAPSHDYDLGLRLSRTQCLSQNGDIDDPPNVVRDRILPALGPLLMYLDMSAYTNAWRTTMVEILRACPRLRVLAVSHGGAFWSRDVRYERLEASSLHELDLHLPHDDKRVVEPAREVLATWLRDVHAIRFCTHDRSGDKLRASRKAIRTLLAHAPSLQYFHWRNLATDQEWMPPYRPTPYADRVAWSASALTQLKLRKTVSRHARYSARAARVTAWLSVVDRKQRVNAAFARLADRDVVARITAFALTRRLPHTVVFESREPQSASGKCTVS